MSLQRILMVNDNDDNPILLSYEKMFEMCCYYERMRVEERSCHVVEHNDGCFLLNKIFKEEPLVCLFEIVINEDTLRELHDGVMLFFPQPALVDDNAFVEGETIEVEEQRA